MSSESVYPSPEQEVAVDEALTKGLRVAVIALAHASETDATYRPAYQHVSDLLAGTHIADAGNMVEELRLRAEAAEKMAGEPGLLRPLVDLRFALGDNGKRMQDELVEYARELAADALRHRWLRNKSPVCMSGGAVSFALWRKDSDDTGYMDAAIVSGGEE